VTTKTLLIELCVFGCRQDRRLVGVKLKMDAAAADASPRDGIVIMQRRPGTLIGSAVAVRETDPTNPAFRSR
jgi:hypothetical protein